MSVFGNDIHQYSASAIDAVKICFIDINIFREIIKDSLKNRINSLIDYKKPLLLEYLKEKKFIIRSMRETITYYHKIPDQSADWLIKTCCKSRSTHCRQPKQIPLRTSQPTG